MDLAGVIIAGLALVVSGITFWREFTLSKRLTEIEEERRNEELEAASKAQLEPAVIYDGDALFFRVENYGGGAATSIKLSARGPSDFKFDSTMLPAVMPPGARWYGAVSGYNRMSLERSDSAGLMVLTVAWEDDFSASDGRASQQRPCSPVPRY